MKAAAWSLAASDQDDRSSFCGTRVEAADCGKLGQISALSVLAEPAGELQTVLPQSSGPDRPILMVIGGGLENGGGIGRLVGYILEAWNDQLRGPMHVIDTRGPKYAPIIWPYFLVRSIWQIVAHSASQPILHIHLAANSSTWRKLLIIQAGRLLHLQYVLHLHDPKYEAFYNNLPGALQPFVQSIFRRAGRVIALGAPAASMSTRVFGVPKERIDIVPNGVPGPKRIVRRDENDSKFGPHILFLGQLQRRKGVHDLIEALSRPEVAAQRWIATVAGGGPDQNGFEEQASRCGVRGRVEFPGWLSRDLVISLLETADILVLPSYAEEMAMSLLEGMAFGLCVVCTPVGAQAEVVEHERSALVVAPGNVDELAAALVKCLSNSELRRRLGDGAREAYIRNYNIADYPERIAAVYRRVATGPAR